MDSLWLLFVSSSHAETRSLTYDLLEEHFDPITAALPSDIPVPRVAQGFDTSEHQPDVESFFKDKDVSVTGSPRVIAQVLESINLNQAFKEAQLASLVEFLKTQ